MWSVYSQEISGIMILNFQTFLNVFEAVYTPANGEAQEKQDQWDGIRVPIIGSY